MANYQKFEGLREEAKMNFNERGGESAIRWNLHKVESAMAESAANGGRWQSKSNQVGHLKVVQMVERSTLIKKIGLALTAQNDRWISKII